MNCLNFADIDCLILPAFLVLVSLIDIKHPTDRTCGIHFLSEAVSWTWEAEASVCVLWERSIRMCKYNVSCARPLAASGLLSG